MPNRKARPANHTEKAAMITKTRTLSAICQAGRVVKAMRIKMVIGAVNGKKLKMRAKVPLGFDMIVVVT